MTKPMKTTLTAIILILAAINLSACGNCFAGGNNRGGGAKCGFTKSF